MRRLSECERERLLKAADVILWVMLRLARLVGAVILCKWLHKAVNVILWMPSRVARLVGAMLLCKWLHKAADVI